MLKIGKFNTLQIVRAVDFGLYLATESGREVLLPNRYVTDSMHIGDMLDVFIYTDSEDRPIATTDRPAATVGQFAFMQVRDVNSFGAFLQWGIAGKDLLVLFSQQKARMKAGGTYLVYVYLDHATMRVAATSKIGHYLGNVIADYRPGQKVEALIIEQTPIGYRTIVDDLHLGMIYENETYAPLSLGDRIDAFVKTVREDGKIDLSLGDIAVRRVASLSDLILDAIEANGGSIAVTDKSSPDDVREHFACSKKDYKKALGHLYKEGKIIISDEKITLA